MPNTLAQRTTTERPFSISGKRLKSMNQAKHEESGAGGGGSNSRASSRLSNNAPLHWGMNNAIFTCGSTAGLNLVRVVVVLGTILIFLHFLPLEGAKGNIR